MRVSFSQVSLYEQCPYRWKLRYKDELEVISEVQETNPLILGAALHKGIEMRDVEAGLNFYRENMNVANDKTEVEEIKLRAMIEKGLKFLPEGEAEVEIEVPGEFKGFIDLLVPTGKPNEYDMYDFKYANANNLDRYMHSRQLSVYKYYVENTTERKIRNMYFIIFPKVYIRKKNTETEEVFRRRIREELEITNLKLIRMPYDFVDVDYFKSTVEIMESDTEFIKDQGDLCHWCEYENFCLKGDNAMTLPKAQRVARAKSGKIKIWVYGEPFSGKTTFANESPMPIMLNTDGNIKFVDAPAIAIKDAIEKDGNMSVKVYGWEVFKSAIEDLQKDPGGFDTVVIDLVEGVYELCRTFMYHKRGWEHESDDTFKAWDIIRKEFIDTMRKATNLDMNVILISHEDATRDFTATNGNKSTVIKPNIADKMAKQLAGMVDIVGRAQVVDGEHVLTFKPEKNIFGGGRIKLGKNQIDLSWDDLKKLYTKTVGENPAPKTKPEEKPKTETEAYEKPYEGTDPQVEEITENAPKKRTRRTRKEA